MKHKNLKVKKACLLLTASIALVGYMKYEHKYTPTYVITNNEDYFATYSNGKIYIGTEVYINSIKDKVDKDDILVIDQRYSKSDPNFQIISSYRINNKDIRNEILEVLMTYEELYPSEWNRTIESMRLEWFVHNASHMFNYKLDHSDDVDLDNDDQLKYENVNILNKLLKL